MIAELILIPTLSKVNLTKSVDTEIMKVTIVYNIVIPLILATHFM